MQEADKAQSFAKVRKLLGRGSDRNQGVSRQSDFDITPNMTRGTRFAEYQTRSRVT